MKKKKGSDYRTVIKICAALCFFKQTFSFICKNKSTLEEFLWGFNVERFLQK